MSTSLACAKLRVESRRGSAAAREPSRVAPFLIDVEQPSKAFDNSPGIRPQSFKKREGTSGVVGHTAIDHCVKSRSRYGGAVALSVPGFLVDEILVVDGATMDPGSKNGAGRAVRRAIEDQVTTHWIDAAYGAWLRVVEAGSGPAVVLVPGWTMGWTVFERQIPALSPANRVVALDPRSQGASTPTVDGNSYAQQGRDIETVVTALGIDRFALIGWSCGAFACYAYLEHAGFGRVERLAILDQTARPFACEHEKTWCEGDWSFFKQQFLVPLGSDRTAFADDFIDWMTLDPLRPADYEWLVGMHANTPIAAATALLVDAIFSDYTATAEAADRTLPVLQVVNIDDVDAAGPWLRTHAPRAQIESAASHFGFWENAQAFNEILLGFLATAR